MADKFTTLMERPGDAQTSRALSHQPEVPGMTTADHSRSVRLKDQSPGPDSYEEFQDWAASLPEPAPRGEGGMWVNAESLFDAAYREEYEAVQAEASMCPMKREVAREYRKAFHDTGAVPVWGNKGGTAPCPVCGHRTAILSLGDPGFGPSIEVYCENVHCNAREFTVTIKRGYVHDPIDWDAADKNRVEKKTVPAQKRERRHQHTWRSLWRVRHGGTLRCNLCGSPESEASIEIDHIVELRDGGEDADWNTQPLCVECHRRKTSARSRR